MAKKWNTRDELSFDVVAETFKLPIVEASAKLGICSATLKRICKEHGIPRWPFRKVSAGKTIEDIKREAAEMLAKGRVSSSGISRSVNGIESQSGGTPGIGPKRIIVKLKGQGKTQGSSGTNPQATRGGLPAQAFSMFSPHPNHPPESPYPYPLPLPNSKRIAADQRKGLKSYLNAFNFGFPGEGLGGENHRWWGKKDSVRALEEREKVGLKEGGKVREESDVSEEKRERDGEEGNEKERASEVLRLKRKRSAEEGREGLESALGRGYGINSLRKQDSEVLNFVFGPYLPNQWNSSLAV